MNLRRKIIEGVAAFSFDTVASTVLSVFSAALAFRYVSVADYGRLTLALTFYATGTLFLDFGLGPVFTAEIARSRGEASLGIVKLFALRYLNLELLTGSTLLLLYFLISRSYVSESGNLWLLMGFYLFATALTNIAVTVFHSYALYSRQAAQSVSRAAARLILIVTLPLWWNGDHLVGLTLTYPLMEFAVVFVSLLMARDIIRALWRVPLPHRSWTMLWDTFKKQGIYASIIIPAKKIQEQLPVWILTPLAGEAAVGAYGAAAGGYGMAVSFFRSVETTMFPLVSQYADREWASIRRALVRTQKYSLWLAILAVAGGWLTADLLIRILAGTAYAEAAPLFRILLLMLLVYTFAQTQRPLFYALKEQRLLFLSYVAGIITYSGVLLVATLAAGLTGATIGVVVAEAIIVYLRFRMLKHINPDIQPSLRELLTFLPEDQQLWSQSIKRVQTFIVRRVKKGSTGEGR